MAARILGKFGSSHEASLEPTIKRRENLGKHSVYIHFPKDRKCQMCQRTKITRGPCRRSNGGAVLRAEFCRFDNSRSEGPKRQLRVSKQSPICSRGAGLGHPMDPSVSVQKEIHRKPREACNSSWSPAGSLKSFKLTIPWNSAKLVKISPGIIARLHHTDHRQMGLVKEQCAE